MNLEAQITEIKKELGSLATRPKGSASSPDSAPLAPEAVVQLKDHELARYIDHTNLRPEADRATIKVLCEEAQSFACAAVCVNPCWVEWCRDCLGDSEVQIAGVIGFPLGATTTRSKLQETREAIQAGADELDMVINLGWVKSGDWQAVHKEIAAVVEGAAGKVVKVIIETGLLSEAEKIACTLICLGAGAHFVKTSTGFNAGGATVEDVRLLRELAGDDMSVKAAGGIRDNATARAMLGAGANRLGASATLAILQNG